jgi:NADPH:quinone reductase-like Zn-dependent oxidoreductase
MHAGVSQNAARTRLASAVQLRSLAAALPLVAITAWEGLVDRAKVCADQTVLVHAGAGRVSTLQSNQRVPMAQESCTTVSGEKKILVPSLLGGRTVFNREADRLCAKPASCHLSLCLQWSPND